MPRPRRRSRAPHAETPASKSVGRRDRRADRRGSPVRAVGQHVLHPVQRLNDAHGGPVGPIETAGRGELEMDLLATELDRLQTRINQHLDTRRHGGGEAEIVGGSHAVDDGAIVGYGRAAG